MRLVIPTCVGFWDALIPQTQLIRRFWPQALAELKPLILTDRIGGAMPGEGFETLALGNDAGWSSNMRIALDRLSDPIVVLLFDDFFLSRDVNHAFVRRCEELMLADPKIGLIRLYPCPGADGDAIAKEPRLGRLSREAPYRASTQTGLWRLSVLHYLLREGENPWDFEIHGSERSKALEDAGWKFLAVRRDEVPKAEWPIEYICTAINKGVWDPAAIELCRREGIAVDSSRRPIAAAP